MVEFEHPYPLDMPLTVQGMHGTEEATDITLRAPGSLVEIALFDDGKSVGQALKKHARLSMPAKPLTAIAYSDGWIFQFGRNRYFIDAEKPDLANLLNDSIRSDQASIIDQSHGRSIIDIKGNNVEEILSKLYAIDFHKSQFTNNSGLATANHGIHTLIWREADDAFTLYVGRSFARSFLDVLKGATLEYGYAIFMEQ